MRALTDLFVMYLIPTDDDDTLALAGSIGRNAASHMYAVEHCLIYLIVPISG